MPASEPLAGATVPASAVVSAPQRAQIFYIGDHVAESESPPAQHTTVDALVEKWSRDPARRAALEDARRWAADAVYGDEGVSVRTLRLTKGFSQSRLAEMIGTSQPHIARIERGTENLMIETCRRLAAALDVDMNTLDQALRRQAELAEINRVSTP